ncbi:TPA: hypothetical protein ACXDAZ_003156 [Clostridium botulinum]|uniref:hypothetical protein n=1 Tax=Clostridium botulinum TaxID=1491 RepID=UPI0008FC2C86|nr:hypothetical protein [Clostridium botulinum]APC81905.1 hypothetical protein NPD2_833 [Clostridium botulinum]APU61308.1 hypothetical protein NPD8_3267 [Clostridium botulinum]MCS4447329.1 hypothetical protein [Clostridium botulinum]MCS4456718.1 hypothetical protein [Clostridium botulinum]MCS4460513.1 hypothetical protein [Clostridium botulinum]
MDEFLLEYVKSVKVEIKPVAVPYNYRIMYKISQLILIIYYCCSSRKGCSLEKLHMISTALTSKADYVKLRSFINGRQNIIIIRFDPAVNRAVTLALAEKLLYRQVNGLFKLDKKGKKFAEELDKDKTLMVREKELMQRISTNLTEDKINGLMADWRINNVES